MVRQDEFFGVDIVTELAPLALKLKIFQKADGSPFESRGKPYWGGQELPLGASAPGFGSKIAGQIACLLYGNDDYYREVLGAVRAHITDTLYEPEWANLHNEEEAPDEELAALLSGEDAPE